MPTSSSRGDIVIVAAPGNYGKAQPAVVVQTDGLPESHASVVVCQLTSDIAEAADFRVTIGADLETGLRNRSQIMVDKPVTIRRERVGRRIGRLRAAEIARLNTALAFVMGLAD